MQKPKEYFDYDTPYMNEIREEFREDIPYRFEEEFLNELDLVFMNPRQKWVELYGKYRWKSDRNEMAQVLYIYVRFSMKYPQQIGHSIENILPTITVNMWRRFIGNQKFYKRLGNDILNRYFATNISKLQDGVGRLSESMIDIIRHKKYIHKYDDMVKVRKGIPLRGKDWSAEEKEILNCEALINNECIGVGEFGDRYDDTERW